MQQVVHVLSTSLKLGGVWYRPQDPVLLNKEDADVYESRGLSSLAPEGTEPKNAPRRTLTASEVGLVTKEVDASTTKEQQRVSTAKRR